MMQHLPILQVLLPLLGAPLAALLRGRDMAWGLALLLTGAAFLISIILFSQQQIAGETLIYDLGGWPAPIGIVYVIDAASALVLPVISGIAFVATIAARRLVEAEIDGRDHALFYAAWLLTIAGMLGQVTTGDAFNIFVFLEISSLSAYALVAMGAGRDRRALPAAFNYLILGTVGATFYVIGLGLLYMLTGTLNLMDLSERLADVQSTRAAFTALAFIALGLFLKMALFPLHFWLVPAYAHAPSAVSALMAATATKVSVYVLIRLVFGVFGIDFPGLADAVGLLVLTLGIAGAFVGTLAAILETDLKKLFAQSSIAQLGYMAIGIGAMSATGLAAAFIHLFNHALMKGGVISRHWGDCRASRACQHGLHSRGGATNSPDHDRYFGRRLGAYRRAFDRRFHFQIYLVRALLEQDFWLLAALTFISSALALAYVWKIIEAAWLKERPKGAPVLVETPVHYVPAWLMVIATIGFGIFASPLVDAAYAAAHVFIGGAR